ncbi:acyl carrier protein [Neptuniibacter marinus]|uniref:acyl carrier protein n=1 Tax=Neptuniibacter marinus TaxID=1806670 RepID=UPI00082E9D25|nr:phosphopantetheine-binding protein [Neptuniibacter marinus]
MFDVEFVVDIINKSGSSVEVKLDDQAKKFSQIGLDSLDMFNVFIELQDATGKEFSDDIVENLVSISTIVEFLNS